MVALAGALTLIPVAAAEAALITYICNDAACSGNDDLSVTDNQLGDTQPLAGYVTWSAMYMGYEVVTNQSQSQPFLTNGMDLNYAVGNQAGTGGGGPIFLFASDTSFTNGTTTAFGSLGGTNPTAGATTTAYICDGNSNTVDFSPCSTNSFTGPLGFNFSLTHPVTASTYALTIGVRVSGVAPGDTATGDLRVTAVPDGGSTAALLGSALVAFGMLRRRMSL